MYYVLDTQDFQWFYRCVNAYGRELWKSLRVWSRSADAEADAQDRGLLPFVDHDD